MSLPMVKPKRNSSIMYTNPQIESSYQENDLGKTLYDLVLETKPKVIVEFGCLYGYSTVAMALALKQLGEGKLKCYDLFEHYQYKHSTLEQTKANLVKYGVEDYVEFHVMDYYDWLDNPEEFDLLHLDISNTGHIIIDTYLGLKSQIEKGSVIVFEGGSEERDNVEWMVKYKAMPINMVQQYTNYEILNPDFPSLSIIKQ